MRASRALQLGIRCIDLSKERSDLTELDLSVMGMAREILSDMIRSVEVVEELVDPELEYERIAREIRTAPAVERKP